MDNVEVVREALQKVFTASEVKSFMEFVSQDRDLLLLIDRDPQKAIETCTEILKIALDK